MPDIRNRASIFAFLFRMDLRYQPAGMTTGLLLASPTCSMVSDTVCQLISKFLQIISPHAAQLLDRYSLYPGPPHFNSPR
jgi:hypothetical protein